MEINYQKKYLKYKNKYSELSNKLHQLGGAFPFPFSNCEILYIMAKIEGKTLDRINERRLSFGLPNKSDLHISLLQLYVNNNHPDYAIFESKEFKDKIVESYKENIIKNNVVLESTQINTKGQKRGIWEFLGRDPNKFWARVYILNQKDKQYISQFRRDIYDYINLKLGQSSHLTDRRGKAPDEDDFEIYTFNGQELYAINKAFYFGIDIWKPHVSVLTISELEQSTDQTISNINDPNSVIYKFIHSGSDDQKINVLRSESGSRSKNIESISNINLNADIKEIKYSINNPKTKINKEEYLSVNKNQVKTLNQDALCTIM
jgi:hypothetical protein